jgi:hypothetical protein
METTTRATFSSTWSPSAPSVALAVVSIQVAAETIIGPDVRASPTAEAQVDLPVRLGGLGLRLPSSGGGEGRVAWLSSISLTQQALRCGAAFLRPFDGPQRPALQEVWQQAQTEAPNLWDKGLAVLHDAYKGH